MKFKAPVRLRTALMFMPLFVLLVACGDSNNGTEKGGEDEYGKGTEVDLALPYESTIQNKFSTIVGWGDNIPVAPSGYRVLKFAENLNSPRWIYEAPNGDIFVSQARTALKSEDPDEDPEEAAKYDGARNVNKEPSADNVLLFRDTDGDGVAEFQQVYASGLKQPFGVLVLGDYFYVANTDGLLRFPYDPASSSVSGTGDKIVEFPEGGYNNHWTRNIIANADGTKIFVAIGSASNVGEYGIDEEFRRACILEINPDGTGERFYGEGLRNPVAMDIEPETKKLWTAVNERDELGDMLVPDYITSVKEGGFYGWPYAYWGPKADPRLEGQREDLVENTIVPDFAVGSHTASLGLAFAKDDNFEKGAYIGQHGSWNRSEFAGFKVLFVPFSGGKPSGEPVDFLTGFIADKEAGTVYGRPCAVKFTQKGYMLVTDDAANVIWAVVPE